MTAERPILFSGPMVRAILEGRKTQTRRVVAWRSKRADAVDDGEGNGNAVLELRDGSVWPYYVYEGHEIPLKSPYGVPGDRLWVRETWAEGGRSMQLPCGEFVWSSHRKARYAATDDSIRDGDASCSWRVRPSIHMPRWASRLTLEVVSVRVERLNEISERDATAEGVYLGTARETFQVLWDSINAKKHPWSSNPWVWVVEFKKLEVSDAR